MTRFTHKKPTTQEVNEAAATTIREFIESAVGTAEPAFPAKP